MRLFLLMLLILILAFFNQKEEAQGYFFNVHSDAVALDRDIQKATTKALRYLAETQEVVEWGGETVGFWRNDVGFKMNSDYVATELNARHLGVTAIACMAFMANGHMPHRGPYGQTVHRAALFMIKAFEESEGRNTAGYITIDGSRTYSHAFAALALAMLYGLDYQGEVDRRMQRAFTACGSFIVNSQNLDGGWRYAPFSAESDTSIVVSMMQALRALHHAGKNVPKQVIEKAQRQIAGCYSNTGAFSYQNLPLSRRSWALTAAGVVALQQSGTYQNYIREDGTVVSLETSLEFLKRGHTLDQIYTLEQFEPQRSVPFDYFYGHYYAAQAFYQASRDNPETWRQWKTAMYPRLLKLQAENGSWTDEVGTNYATAMAALILQLDKEYLPIFQK